jgi:prepilin-type N-terminal cleavage/methylation domain-containing protein
MWRKNRHRGFTLIETLVVVALFAIISVSLFSSFSMGMKVWKWAVSPNASHRKSLLALERLSTELRRTFNYSRIGFFGEKEGISFANIVGGRIYNISYTTNGSDKGFYRQSRSMQEILGMENETKFRKIVPSVKDATFAFYGFDNEKGHADFLDAWNYSRSGLPAAVKVSLELEDGETFEKIILIPVGQ